MSNVKGLGRYLTGLDLKNAGDMLALAVCRGKMTQKEANAKARQIMAWITIGKLETIDEVEDMTIKLGGQRLPITMRG